MAGAVGAVTSVGSQKVVSTVILNEKVFVVMAAYRGDFAVKLCVFVPSATEE